MFGFRSKFAAKRFASGRYYKKLSKVLEQPSRFYVILAMKLLPAFHSSPMDLRLKDGKTIRVKEFWTLFLFDEIFMQSCYDAPALVNLTNPTTIVDVGANIGCFALRAKQLWPGARIIAIEPDPDNFAALEENIALSGLDGVTSLQIGLSDKCGSVELYLSPRNIGGHSMYKKTGRSVKVKAQTLVQIISMLGPDGFCDILKIDCEGCEYPLLSTLTPEIASRIGCIIFEAERGLYELDKLKLTLQSVGFEVSNFSDLIVCTQSAEMLKARPTRVAS